jgi:hypothetical protein
VEDSDSLTYITICPTKIITPKGTNQFKSNWSNLRLLKVYTQIWAPTGLIRSRDISVDILKGSGATRPGCKIFLFPTVSTPVLKPTQPPIQWVPGALSPRVKRPGREADHSPPSSAEVKNGGDILSLPHTSSWRSAELIKHRDNFILQVSPFASSRVADKEVI